MISPQLIKDPVQDPGYITERLEARFQRVETFLAYLKEEEERELSDIDDGNKLGGYFVSRIRQKFCKERAYIRRRVKENRERWEEDWKEPEEEIPLVGYDSDEVAAIPVGKTT